MHIKQNSLERLKLRFSSRLFVCQAHICSGTCFPGCGFAFRFALRFAFCSCWFEKYLSVQLPGDTVAGPAAFSATVPRRPPPDVTRDLYQLLLLTYFRAYRIVNGGTTQRSWYARTNWQDSGLLYNIPFYNTDGLIDQAYPPFIKLSEPDLYKEIIAIEPTGDRED